MNTRENTISSGVIPSPVGVAHPQMEQKDTLPTIRNLFQLHPQASTQDVAAHGYSLSKQAETIIAQLEDMTACIDSLSERGNEISWLLATLAEITRQQVICSERLDEVLSLDTALIDMNTRESRVILAHRAIKDLTDMEVDDLNAISFGSNKAASNNKFTSTTQG